MSQECDSQEGGVGPDQDALLSSGNGEPEEAGHEGVNSQSDGVGGNDCKVGRPGARITIICKRSGCP